MKLFLKKKLPEKDQLKTCKSLLGVQRSATNNAVRAEIGIFPIAFFGLKQYDSLVYKAYIDSITLRKGFGNNFKIFLEYLHFNHVWQNQGTFSNKCLVNAIFNKIKIQFDSFWKVAINKNESDNKLSTYCKLKDNFN